MVETQSKLVVHVYKSLLLSYTHIIDIDECRLGTDQCAQNCHNYLGYYTCSCNAGYYLSSDGRHCDGIIRYLFSKYNYPFYPKQILMSVD